MVRPVWVAVAFVAGLFVGVVVMRMQVAPAVVPAVAHASQMAPQVVSPLPAAASQPAPVIAGSTPDAAHVPVTAGSTAAPPAPRAPVPTSLPAVGQNPFPPLPVDDGSPIAQPIDIGEPFRSAMNKLTPEGDTIADAHRALERETRDDAWSYQSESDIQSTLIPETGAGNFNSQYVECRSTLCEVRLSAQNDTQAEALRVWADGLAKQPWASQLYPMYSSSITKNGKTDRVIILRRPKK